jgi:hypothetical protein
LLITAAFLLLLLAAITATTIMSQSDIHPDNWTTTAYDIAAMVLFAFSYIAVLVRTCRKFLKEKRVTVFRTHNQILGALQNMKSLFRYIVAISTALFVVLWLLPFFDYLWLSPDELDLAAAAGFGSYIPSHIAIYWSLFIAWLATSIGLFFFFPIARTSFLILLVVTAIASFFSGFSVMTPLSAGISGIVILSDGIIITMAYFTSVSKHFMEST